MNLNEAKQILRKSGYRINESTTLQNGNVYLVVAYTGPSEWGQSVVVLASGEDPMDALYFLNKYEGYENVTSDDFDKYLVRYSDGIPEEFKGKLCIVEYPVGTDYE